MMACPKCRSGEFEPDWYRDLPLRDTHPWLLCSGTHTDQVLHTNSTSVFATHHLVTGWLPGGRYPLGRCSCGKAYAHTDDSMGSS